jgi:hypothetical protein
MRDQRSVFGSVSVGVLTLALLSGAIFPSVVGGRSGARESRASSPSGKTEITERKPSASNGGQSTPAAGLYRKAPLSFEANQGQFDPSVKFRARGSGYQLHLTPTEAVLSLKRDAKETENKQSEKDFSSGASARRSSTDDVVRMRLLGASSNPRMRGEDVLPGKVNYLLGNDPRAWRTNVTTYGKVKYENV